MRIESLARYRARDTVEVLTKLLKDAKAGKVKGIVIAWEGPGAVLETAITGEYARHPIHAMGAAGKLFSRANDLHEKR
jgi:hypothetical protein